MTADQKAAFIQSQSTIAFIEAMKMVAENEWREHIGQPPRYDGSDFQRLLDRFEPIIGNNAVINLFE